MQNTNLRFVPSNLPHHLAPVLDRILQLTVAVPQEYHLGYSQQLRGVLLLHLPGGGQPFGRHFAIAGALVPVGRHQHHHVGTRFGYPLGHRSAATALGIVRVRSHHQRAGRRLRNQTWRGCILLVGESPAINTMRPASHSEAPEAFALTPIPLAVGEGKLLAGRENYVITKDYLSNKFPDRTALRGMGWRISSHPCGTRPS